MEEIYKIIGERLRLKRRELGMTLNDVEEISGLSGSFVGQIERNVKKTSLVTISKMALALDIPLERLLAEKFKSSDSTIEKQVGAVLRRSTVGEKKVLLSTLRHLAKRLKTIRH